MFSYPRDLLMRATLICILEPLKYSFKTGVDEILYSTELHAGLRCNMCARLKHMLASNHSITCEVN